MPVDHKRINGPEDTLPYELFAKKNKQTLSESFEEILKNGIRKDSRSFHEHRKIFIKTGVVSQAKGSAYIEMEKSKVIVSVFDPREIPNRSDYSLKGEIYCEFKFAPFSCKKRRLHQLDTEEKQYSVIMKQALESTVCRHEFPNFQSWMHTGVDVGMEFFKLYFGNVSPSKIPAWYQNEIQCTSKSQIQSEFGDAVDIYAMVLHNDGSCLSAAITAAGLALSHAGVPMYDIITSVTLGIQQDTIFVDPSCKEQNISWFPLSKDTKNNDHGLIVISKLHTHNQISHFYQTGSISLAKVTEAIGIVDKACEEIVPLIKKCLVKHVIKNLKNSETVAE